MRPGSREGLRKGGAERKRDDQARPVPSPPLLLQTPKGELLCEERRPFRPFMLLVPGTRGTLSFGVLWGVGSAELSECNPELMKKTRLCPPPSSRTADSSRCPQEKSSSQDEIQTPN